MLRAVLGSLIQSDLIDSRPDGPEVNGLGTL